MLDAGRRSPSDGGVARSPSLTDPRISAKLSQFQMLQKIGQGAYGVVHKALDLNTNQFVALKKMKIPCEDDKNTNKEPDTEYMGELGLTTVTLREIAVMKELDSPNIVRLQDVVVHVLRSRVYLVFEYLDRDLKKQMDSLKGQHMSPALQKSYAYQILSGLAYLHSHRVIHRDLKPQNILIDANGNLKLADFGLARVFTLPLRSYTFHVVTQWYRCPELLLGCIHYSTALDIWSAGCIIAELSELKPIFNSHQLIAQLHAIFKQCGTPNEATWPGVSSLGFYSDVFPKWPRQPWSKAVPHMQDPNGLALVDSLLKLDPTQRISAREALVSPYFQPPATPSRKSSRNGRESSSGSPERWTRRVSPRLEFIDACTDEEQCNSLE